MPRLMRRRPARASLCRRLSLGLGLIAAASSPALASQISPAYALTAVEQGKATVLDQNGRTVPTHRGVWPTYIAYRLDNPAAVPDGIATVAVKPSQGRTSGPLRLDSATQAELNSALASSGQVAVLMPRRTYLVESIAPLSARIAASSAAATATASTSTPTAPTISAAVDRAEGTVKKWYNTSANAFKRWSSEVGDSLKTRIKLRSPRIVDVKPPAPTPSTTTTAAPQVLVPPAAQILAAPVPEPASLLVFAMAGVAAGLRLRRRA